MSSDQAEIKLAFHAQIKRFVLINIIAVTSLAAVLWQAKSSDYYREAFIGVTILFLIWIFTVGKFYRCPACQQSPRGKEGLISPAKVCANCGVLLRD